MCYLDPVIYLSSFVVVVVVVVSPLLVFSGFLDLFLKFLLHIGLALGNSGGGGHSRYCFSSVDFLAKGFYFCMSSLGVRIRINPVS